MTAYPFQILEHNTELLFLVNVHLSAHNSVLRRKQMELVKLSIDAKLRVRLKLSPTGVPEGLLVVVSASKAWTITRSGLDWASL